MKKLFLLLALIGTFGFGQEVTLTPDNFKDKANPDKDYVVLQDLGQDAKQLFDKTKMYFFSEYKVSKDTPYSEVDGKSIVVDVRGSKNIVKMFNPTGANSYNTNIRYEFKFKDGKVMVKPFFALLVNNHNGKFDIDVPLIKDGFLGYGIYKKNGKSNGHDDVVKEIDDEVNELISSLKNYLNKKEDW
ncbi:hypothetical protein ACQ1PF_10255 [Ornithobacterium rhinotracheale]